MNWVAALLLGTILKVSMDTEDIKVAQVEKLAAASFLQDAARPLWVREFPAGRLVEWVNENSLPSIKCCTLCSPDENVYVPNASLEDFVRLLGELQPKLGDLELVCTFFEKASPQTRRALKQLPVWLKDLAEVWHPPQFDEHTFTAFFENSTDGKIEQVTLSSDYALNIKFIRKGPQLTLR